MDNIGAYVVPAAIALVAISIVARGIRIVQQAQTMIIERLGKYHRTLSSGVNLIIPIVDKPRAIDWHQVIVTPTGDSFARHFRTDKIDLRETVYVFPRQNVITKDNVVVEIDALIYSQITDPVRATYEIANLPDAIEKLTQTTLRNVIGEMELDHVLSSRDTINAKLREILDEATHKWGAKVPTIPTALRMPGVMSSSPQLCPPASPGCRRGTKAPPSPRTADRRPCCSGPIPSP